MRGRRGSRSFSGRLADFYLQRLQSFNDPLETGRDTSLDYAKEVPRLRVKVFREGRKGGGPMEEGGLLEPGYGEGSTGNPEYGA